jgi:tetratricopeptide (TPR) repeat protein
MLRCAVAVVLTASWFLPLSARAHGELLIRISALSRQIEAATNNLGQLYLQRGELYREDRNWDAAESDYARAAQLDRAPTVDVCRGRMLSEAGRLEAALVVFTQVINTTPCPGEALIGRARVQVKLSHQCAAVLDYQEALGILVAPEADHFLELAGVLDEEHQPQEAIRALDEGIKRFGPLIPLQLHALDLELARKNYDSALARLDTIIQQSARKEYWLARRGDILSAQGRGSDARIAYQSSLAAIGLLPARLQQNPPMMNLKARVNAQLAVVAGNSASTIEPPGRARLLPSRFFRSDAAPLSKN